GTAAAGRSTLRGGATSVPARLYQRSPERNFGAVSGQEKARIMFDQVPAGNCPAAKGGPVRVTAHRPGHEKKAGIVSQLTHLEPQANRRKPPPAWQVLFEDRVTYT